MNLRTLRTSFIIILSFTCLLSLVGASTKSTGKDALFPAELKQLNSPVGSQSTPSNNQNTQAPTTSRLWNLQNVDILNVVNEVSKETGKNFIVDPRVQGKVTIVSSRPMNADEVYQVFLAVLQIHGFSAIPSGNVIKIIPDMEAKQQPAPVVDAKHPGKGDELVVRVIPVKNVSAEQLVPILRPLLPPAAELSAYGASNLLIISGRANKIKHLVDVIENVDNSNSNSIEIIHLKHATASDVVTIINSLQQTGRANPQGPQISLAADSRTNSILLSGDQGDRIRMRVLISQMDTPDVGKNAGNTEVIYLRYLKAKDFAPVLAGIAQSAVGDTAGSAGSTSSITSASTPVSLAAQTSSTPSAANDKGAINLTPVSISVGKKVQIQAEPNTNAVIISAPPSIMHTLKSVVSKLDVRPAQVLVEAIIVEVSESISQQLGIQWGTRTLPGANPANDSFSSLSGGLGIGFINKGSMRILVRALANDSATNILSTPSLIVLNNQKATIKVGQKVSFTTGSYPSNATGSSVTPFTTTNREDVALHLNVTPQINQANSVQLLIDQGNETLSNKNSANGDPITNNSSIITTVMVNSDQILVLGGLISHDHEESDQKVPLLGDIPGLGAIFRSKSHNLEKKNLMVFLRPVILHSGLDGSINTQNKYEYIREQELIKQRNADPLAPKQSYAVVPNWHKPAVLPKPFE